MARFQACGIAVLSEIKKQKFCFCFCFFAKNRRERRLLNLFCNEQTTEREEGGIRGTLFSFLGIPATCCGQKKKKELGNMGCSCFLEEFQ